MHLQKVWSAIFEHGKTGLIKKLQSSTKLQMLAAQMSNLRATVEEVVEAGRQIFLLMFGGEASDSLAKLRHRIRLIILISFFRLLEKNRS